MMAESNPYDRRTEPDKWQQWLNEQVAKHDEDSQKSSDEGQQFEIAPDDK